MRSGQVNGSVVCVVRCSDYGLTGTSSTGRHSARGAPVLLGPNGPVATPSAPSVTGKKGGAGKERAGDDKAAGKQQSQVPVSSSITDVQGHSECSMQFLDVVDYSRGACVGMVDTRSDVQRNRSSYQCSEMCPRLSTAPYSTGPHTGHRKECADTASLAVDHDASQSGRGQIGFGSLSVSSIRRSTRRGHFSSPQQSDDEKIPTHSMLSIS